MGRRDRPRTPRWCPWCGAAVLHETGSTQIGELQAVIAVRCGDRQCQWQIARTAEGARWVWWVRTRDGVWQRLPA